MRTGSHLCSPWHFRRQLPCWWGCVIAYVLNILLKRIERFWFPGTKRKFLIKLRRPVCILLSFLALVLIMAGVVYLVVPELVSSIRLVTDEIPPVIEEIRLWAIALEEMQRSRRTWKMQISTGRT